MPSDMTEERLERIHAELTEAYGDKEAFGNVATEHIQDLCLALEAAWKREKKALGGIKQLAESNKQLRRENVLLLGYPTDAY